MNYITMCLTLLIGLGCGESAFGSAEASEIKLSAPTAEFKVLRVGSSPHIPGDSSNPWYRTETYKQELNSVGLQLKDVVHVTLENADFIHGDYMHYQVHEDFCDTPSTFLPTSVALLGKIPFSRPLPIVSSIAKSCGPDGPSIIRSWYKSGFFDIIISDRSTLDGYAWPFKFYPRALKVGGIFVATDVNRNGNTTAFETTTEGKPYIKSIPIGGITFSIKLKVSKFPSFAEFERAYSDHPYLAKIKKLYQLGHQDHPLYAPGQYDPDKPVGFVVVERLGDTEPEAIKQPEPAKEPALVMQPALFATHAPAMQPGLFAIHAPAMQPKPVPTEQHALIQQHEPVQQAPRPKAKQHVIKVEPVKQPTPAKEPAPVMQPEPVPTEQHALIQQPEPVPTEQHALIQQHEPVQQAPRPKAKLHVTKVEPVKQPTPAKK